MTSTHEDLDEPIFSEEALRRRRFLKYAGFGFGATAVIFPALYFGWRSRSVIGSRISHSLRSSKAPPPRRVALSETNMTKTVSALDGQGTGTLHSGSRTNNPRGLVLDYMSAEGISSYLPRREEITGTSAWLAIRAFAIATAGVVTVFGTGLSLFIWSWDIHNMEDFKVKMRYAIGSILPTISSQVHRPLTPAETGIQNPEESSRLLEGMSSKAIETWTWDAAKERLEAGFKEGGAEGWVAVAAREMEIENQHELQKREQGKPRSAGVSSIDSS